MGKFDIDRPIAELFSVEPYALRIRNVCNSHDIATIRELCLHSNWDLLHFRHLGERSIAHMEEMLGNFGLRLGMTDYGSECTFDLSWQIADNIKWKTRLWGYTTYKRAEIEWENKIGRASCRERV